MSKNWTADSGTTVTMTSSAGTVSGAAANIVDGDTATVHSAGGTPGGSVVDRITFASAVALTSVYCKLVSDGSSSGFISVILRDAALNIVATLVSASGTPVSVDTTYTGPWSGVKYIDVTAGGGGVYGGGGTIYEITAYGTEPYFDKGLRIRNGAGSTVTLALEALAAHAFRFRAADGVTYGIPLVDTGNSSASPVRVYTGSATKSWAKYA